MKKRLTMNDLAYGNLRSNRKQYIGLTLGIVLAIYFVSTMLLMGQSMNHTAYMNHVRTIGSQDVMLFDTQDIIDPDELIELGYAKQVGSMSVIGEAIISNSGMVQFSYYGIGVAYLDETAIGMGGYPLALGRLPKAQGELACEKRALRYLAPGAQIGDEITIELKSLMGGGQFLDQTVSRKYTLVGILSSSSRNHSRSTNTRYVEKPSIYVYEEPIEAGTKPAIHLMVELNDGVLIPFFEAYLKNKLAVQHLIYHMDSFVFIGILSDTFSTIHFLIIVLVLVLVCSACMGIVNAFTALLTQRRSQIGLLRAVGATRRQIRRIFGREALIIALISAPLAVGLSFVTVWVFCAITGLFDFYVTLPFVIVTIIASLICVMVTALIPLRRASETSPMQAIRDTSLLRIKKNLKIKQQSQFNVSTLLAKRHNSFYRNKQVGISVIVALSLVILALLFAIIHGASSKISDKKPSIDYILQSNTMTGEFIDDYYSNPRFTEADRQYLLSLPTVRQVAGERELTINLVMDEVTDYLLSPFPVISERYSYLLATSSFHEYYRELMQQRPQTGELLKTSLWVVDEAILMGIAQNMYDGSIDIDAINRGDEVLVCAPKEQGFRMGEYNHGSQVIAEVRPISVWDDYDAGYSKSTDALASNDMFFVGDTLNLNYLYNRQPSKPVFLEDTSQYDFTTNIGSWDGAVQIGGLFGKENRLKLELRAGAVVTTFAGLNALGFPYNGYNVLNVSLSKTPSDELSSYLADEINSIAQLIPGAYVLDAAADQEMQRNASIQANIGGAAVMILFYAICLSMVNNALTNRMRSEKRTIGTMRAVGASLDIIAKSYFKQLFIMLSSGFAAGITLSILMIWLFNILFSSSTITLPLWLLVLGELAFVALVLVACMLNLRIRLKTIMKSSIVDNIREL